MVDLGVMCARNLADERCTDVFNNVTFAMLSVLPSALLSVPTNWRNGIESNCCLYTYVQYVFIKTYVEELFAACGVDHAGSCIGAFFGELTLSAGLSTVTVNYLILVASLLIVMTL